MFTIAEIVCGAAGFLIILGMLIIATKTLTIIGFSTLILGVAAIAIATVLHEND